MTLHEAYMLLGGDARDVLTRLGDRALLMKYLRQFPEDDTMQRLRQAVTVGDQAAACQAAHTLGGTCKTLGLEALAAAAGWVEHAAGAVEQTSALPLLEQAYEQAVAVIRLLEDRDTGLAMLIHELRTPLQVILGTAETRQAADGMERITRAAKHMSAILACLEELSLERPLCREPISLPEVMRGAIELLRGFTGSDGPCVEIRARLRHEWVLGDATRLTQVLLNLLTNAARHAAASDVIQLHASQTDEGVELSVRDHGAGMTAQEQQRAFTPYWRASSVAGMGLGLPIVRGLVERMGGCIRLDSAPGEGTTVTVRLPMRPAEAARNDEEPIGLQFDGLRALLAEDDRVSAEVSQELLAGLGIHASVARSGHEAVCMARGGGFDCVFLDAHLSDADGLSVLGDIRLAMPDAPVFALTGGVSLAEKERLLSAGTRECLLKPVSARQVARLLSVYFPDR